MGDGSPSDAFRAALAVIPYLSFIRVGLGLFLWWTFSATTDQGEPSIELADQTTFVAPNGSMAFVLLIDPGDANTETLDPEISLVVHGLVESEDELDGPLPQIINRTEPTPLSLIEQPVTGLYRLVVPVRSGPQFDDQDRIRLPEPGVYPVTVELRTEEGPIATTRTHIVLQPDPEAAEVVLPNQPQRLAVILPITRSGLTIDEAIPLLQAHPAINLTALVDAPSMERLGNEPDIAAALAEALAARPVLAATEPNLDPSALAEIDQAGLFVELAEASDRSLTKLGLVPAADLKVLNTPPTRDGMAVLSSVGIRWLVNIDGRPDDSGSLGVVAGGNTVRMVAADAEISSLLDGEPTPHRANRLLTRLALRHREKPSPVLIAPTEPDPASIDALFRFLTRARMIGGPPGSVPQAVLVTELGGESGPAERVALGTLRPSERPAQNLRPVADVLRRVQQKLATYEGFDVGSAAETQAGQIGAFRRGMAAALSTTNSPETRLQILENLEATLDQGLGVINLHDGQPVTLAARSAPIPVVVDSVADGPRKVMLRLRSDKVQSIDDQRIIEIRPGTTSIDVELELRSLGVSPLEVSMWTPDGTTMLASTRFEIRSTAIPGLGLLVSGGAVVLLGAWWVLDARSRRRSRDSLEHLGTRSASV